MTKKPMRVAVTGGAGQIAYNLLFRIASGEMLGANQPIILHILEVPEMVHTLEGVAMELFDCAFPTLVDVVYGDNPKEVFKEVDLALLVGAKPRSKGMERNDLLKENARIFIGQGKALNEVASKNIQVLVIGNPCNTNCWITMKCAPNIPKERFHALMRLDQNRGAYQLAKKAKALITDVERVLIWGNHSATQVPDILNTRINKSPVQEVIKDHKWLKEDFFKLLQQRGAAIIEARGKSSAASAANAVIDAVRSLMNPTPSGQWYSDGIYSNGNPYGIQEDLIFSFPCTSTGHGQSSIVHGLQIDPFLKEKLAITERELLEERAVVQKILEESR